MCMFYLFGIHLYTVVIFLIPGAMGKVLLFEVINFVLALSLFQVLFTVQQTRINYCL